MRETALWSISALAGVGLIIEATRGDYFLIAGIAAAVALAFAIGPVTRRYLR